MSTTLHTLPEVLTKASFSDFPRLAVGVQAFDTEAHGGNLAAPMPGKVIAVLVEVGATVERGMPLVILEAMKMEHTIIAPAAGTVKEILYQVGEQVPEGAALIAFET